MAGILVIAYFALGHFGYEFNLDYFKNTKTACEQKLRECSDQFIRQGIDNAKCDIVCADPKLIIKKK
jgi:hypothetical protein